MATFSIGNHTLMVSEVPVHFLVSIYIPMGKGANVIGNINVLALGFGHDDTF